MKSVRNILTREFKEPNHKYICISACLFYKEGYSKLSRDVSAVKDVTESKTALFYKNINKNLDMFEDKNGPYPPNSYFRLYYDESVYRRKEHTAIIERMRKMDRVQLIRFDYARYKSQSDSRQYHMELFGTLMRFHAIFDKESPNIEVIITIDADNAYYRPYFELLDKFRKSRALICTISRPTMAQFYAMDYYRDKSLDSQLYPWFCAGLMMFKRDKIFSTKLWDKYITNMYKQQDIIAAINYIDFKRYAFNEIVNGKIEGTDKIDPQSDISQSYLSFAYGMDEIWLNVVFKNILIDKDMTDRIMVYNVRDFNLYLIITRLAGLFYYNRAVNRQWYDKFVGSCKFLQDSKDLIEYTLHIGNKKNKANIRDMIKFCDNIAANPYIDCIYISGNIRYIIGNIQKLINNSKNNHYFSELTSE
jgi:hypothetical protein